MNSVRAAALIVIGASCGVTESRADEGGVSFWLPGQYASLTAVPQTPGWSFGVIYYHTQASADADKAFQLGSQLRLGVDATGDLTVLAPTYVFANPLLGGQASAGLGVAAGYVQGNADAILTGPGGNQVSGSLRDDRWGFGDLYPNVSLRWNQGVHSTTVVLSGDIPVGAYDADRLANLASVTQRSTAASVTRTSILRQATSSLRLPAQRTTTRTMTPSTRMGSTATSIGAGRSSYQRRCRSASPGMSFSS